MRTGPDSFTLDTSSVPVLAVHPHPIRFNAYVDIRHAGLAGLEGFANVVTGAPDPARPERRQTRPVRLAGRRYRAGHSRDVQGGPGRVEQFASVFIVMQMFVLGLALLIAFNTANINSDERARDHATMFAYGVPVRRVLGILAAEASS